MKKVLLTLFLLVPALALAQAEANGGVTGSITVDGVTLGGSAPQIVCGSAVAVCELDSPTADAVTSSTVPAILLKPTVNINNNDLAFGIQNSAGAYVLGMTEGTGLLCISNGGPCATWIRSDGANLFFASGGSEAFEMDASSDLALQSHFTGAPFRLLSDTADSYTSTTQSAFLLKPTVNITDGDLIFAIQNSGSTTPVLSVDEQGRVAMPGGFTGAASSSMKSDGSSLTFSGGGSSNPQLIVGNASGDVAWFKNQVGASAASATVPSYRFDHANGTLGSGDAHTIWSDNNTALTLMKLITDGTYGTITGPNGSAAVILNDSAGYSYGYAAKNLQFDSSGARFADVGNAGSCTLDGATPAVCTATVRASTRCQCSNVGTTAATAALGCAVSLSSTTLTITSAALATHVVNYLCL